MKQGVVHRRASYAGLGPRVNAQEVGPKYGTSLPRYAHITAGLQGTRYPELSRGDSMRAK